jgi:hypothetical protein
MTERDQYDFHLAQDLINEADRMIATAMTKLHAASALFRVDEERPSSAQRAQDTDDAYALLRRARGELFASERPEFR